MRPSLSQAMLPPGTRDHIAPPISGMLILYFTFLCLTGRSLADAARLLFIIGYCDGHLLAVYSHVLASYPGSAHCVAILRYTFMCMHMEFGRNKIFYGRSKVENGRQIVHALFISNFILCALHRLRKMLMLLCMHVTSSIFSTGGKFHPDYGLLA